MVCPVVGKWCKQSEEVGNERSLHLNMGPLPRLMTLGKHWKLSFLPWGKICLLLCQKGKDVVRKEGSGRGGGRRVFTGFLESDINGAE
jgi:hypothetical protein